MLNSPTVKATATESPVRIRTADLMAVSPSGPIPPKAPETRSANPETASLPETAMARKLTRSETRSAAIAPQSGSRAGAKSRVRSSGNRGHLAQHHPAAARRAGMAHLPEDRRRLALCGSLSVEENLALGHHSSPPYARGLLIDRRGRRAMARRLIAEFDVRTPDPDARTADLSGGNQQKLVAARELSGGAPPRLIVAVHPTRGLDPGASRRVQEALFAAQRGGAAILVVSLDLDELRQLSHRILVVFEGRIAGEAAPDASDEQLGRMMLGQVPAVA